VRLRDRLAVPERHQRAATRLLQVLLVAVLAVGLLQRNTGVVVNGGVALAVTALPGVLERDLKLPMDAGLTLWITTAVFLHAVGTVRLPWAGVETFYRSLWWYDHVTHALSASVVAAAGYTVVRALDVHTRAIRLPSQFTFVFVLLFVLAFGVAWEVLEFGLARLSRVTGGSPVLTQYGVADTMLDLCFNTVGAVVAAAWGTAHLSDVAVALAARLDRR
jgi:hypothetical protein